MIPCPYGFRIVGATWEERRLVDATAALAGYAACDERAQVERESYLSAFQFGEDFKARLESTGSTKGYNGVCWAPWLLWDIDRESDLQAALSDARRLAMALAERFAVDDDLLIFYSGSKGFHVGLSTSLWQPEPAADFNRIAKRFCEAIAERAGVAIDAGVYDQVRPFRAANSRHPKTGWHKRRLSFDELAGLSLQRILQLAEVPEPFELPASAGRNDQAAGDWRDAGEWVREQAEEKARRRAAGNGTATLNRATLEFIRAGADQGDRHRLLFSAAANLGEFDCPPALAHALLSEAALDSGLPPADVCRQVLCGLQHGQGGVAAAPAGDPETAEPSPAGPAPAADLKAQLAALWASPSPLPATGEDDGVGDLANGDSVEPAEEEVSPPDWKSATRPKPPMGATLFFQDERCRPCSAEQAYLWTWSGAQEWLYAKDHPVPGTHPKAWEP
jgi:hypothetical protein